LAKVVFLVLGLGNSFQKNFFLPEAHTDFIFAVLVEELGVIGGIFLIAVYVVLFIGMLNVALSCMKLNRVFQGLVCFGTTILFAFPNAI
jgi:cell division protein FtsW